jgi:hypothetical protein
MSLYDTIARIIDQRVGPFLPAFELAVVTSVVDNRARIRRLTSDTEDPVLYPALASFSNPTVGDTVLCARLRNQLVLLGRITSPTSPPRGNYILTVPVIAERYVGAAMDMSLTPTYTEFDIYARLTIPFASLYVTALRMIIGWEAGLNGQTKGVQVTDLSDVEIIRYESTAATVQGVATDWVTPNYSTDQVVKFKAMHANSGVMRLPHLTLQLQVGT